MKLLLCASLAFGKLLLNEEPSPMEGEEKEPIDTFIIVKEADFEKYNVGEHAPCPNPQGFEVVMCTSYMCTECVSDWCAPLLRRLPCHGALRRWCSDGSCPLMLLGIGYLPDRENR